MLKFAEQVKDRGRQGSVATLAGQWGQAVFGAQGGHHDRTGPTMVTCEPQPVPRAHCTRGEPTSLAHALPGNGGFSGAGPCCPGPTSFGASGQGGRGRD